MELTFKTTTQRLVCPLLMLFFIFTLPGCGGDDAPAAAQVSVTTTPTPTSVSIGVSPDTVSGLVLWLNADNAIASGSDINGNTGLSEPTISAWNDDSGQHHNFAQVTAQDQPYLKTSAINGHNAIQFDNAARYLDAGDVLGSIFAGASAAYTVFVVAQCKHRFRSRHFSPLFRRHLPLTKNHSWGTHPELKILFFI